LAQVQTLHTLRLAHNSLKNLEYIRDLTALETLDLAHNQIATNRMGGLSCIENVSSSSRLSTLSFINNPVMMNIHDAL
jgi:Leucine-rich repeat (LRR) protein